MNRMAVPSSSFPLLSPVSDEVEVLEGAPFIDSHRPASVLKGLCRLYENRELIDVTLTCGSREFKCHKSILAVSSPYFMAMFSHDMLERRSNSVKLKDIDADTLERILEYIYSGEIHLTEGNVQNILSTSNIFQLDKLKYGCESFMMKHITKTNCIEVYFFAKAHACTDLAKKSREMICTFFTDLCSLDEFLVLPTENLIEIIRDDELNVENEEEVYIACLSWLNYDLEERQDSIAKLMSNVRFALISPYYFCDHIETNPLLNSSPEVNIILQTVRNCHMLSNRMPELDLNYMTRKGMNRVHGVLVLANPYSEENHKKYNSMEMLLPNCGQQLIHVCRLPQSLYMPGCAVTGQNQIYVAGGMIRKLNYRGSMQGDEVSNMLYQYNCSTKSWEIKTKLRHARAQFTFTVVDGNIYAVGGGSGGEMLSSVERYDPSSNQWSCVSPLPQPLRCAGSVSFKGRLYIFGGENAHHKIVSTVYRYDPAADSWSTLPSMLKPRALAGCVVYKDQIYVIGGNTATTDKWKREFLPEHCTNSVEIYDPADNSWMLGPDLPHALCGAGVVKYRNTVVVVGGEDDKSWMAGICSLIVDADKNHRWSEGEPLPTVMSTFGCMVATLPKDLLSQD